MITFSPCLWKIECYGWNTTRLVITNPRFWCGFYHYINFKKPLHFSAFDFLIKLEFRHEESSTPNSHKNVIFSVMLHFLLNLEAQKNDIILKFSLCSLDIQKEWRKDKGTEILQYPTPLNLVPCQISFFKKCQSYMPNTTNLLCTYKIL